VGLEWAFGGGGGEVWTVVLSGGIPWFSKGCCGLELDGRVEGPRCSECRRQWMQ
jgi:hypothetical protein